MLQRVAFKYANVPTGTTPVLLEFWENKLQNQLVDMPSWVLHHKRLTWEPESGCVFVDRFTLVKPGDFLIRGPNDYVLHVSRDGFRQFFDRYNVVETQQQPEPEQAP